MEVVWAWLLEHIGITSIVAISLLGAIIEITPIKINPWTAIKNFFVAPANTAKEIGNIKENVSKLDTKISSVEENTKKIAKLETQVDVLNSNIDIIHNNLHAVNKSLNQVYENIDSISTKVVNVDTGLTGVKDRLAIEREERKEQYMKELRLTILTFGDELQYNREEASREHFDQIMKVIDEYEDYCDTHPDFPNNKCLMTIQYIKEVYRKKFLAVNN